MLTLHNILKELGFKEEDGKVYIESDAEILKAYPRLLQDDGMGYGVRTEYITEADKEIYQENVMVEDFVITNSGKLGVDKVVKEETLNVFNVFRDVPHNKKEEDDTK